MGGSTGPGSSTRRESILDPTLGRPVAQERRSAHVGDGGDRLPGAQASRDLHDRALAVAEDQQVRARVNQHRRMDLVGPVVEVGDAPQAGLDAADDDGHVGERLATSPRVHRHGTVGSQPRRPAWRVGVVGPQPALRRIAVHHRVHVAGGDTKHDVVSAQLGNCIEIIEFIIAFLNPSRISHSSSTSESSWIHPEELPMQTGPGSETLRFF